MKPFVKYAGKNKSEEKINRITKPIVENKKMSFVDKSTDQMNYYGSSKKHGSIYLENQLRYLRSIFDYRVDSLLTRMTTYKKQSFN